MYKYAENLAEFQNCPDQNCRPSNEDAYRFVHDQNPQARSFLPVSVIDPKRTFKGGKICAGYSLSMFRSIEEAKARYDALKKIPNICKRIGTKLAFGNITPDMGECTPPDSKGHFEFFEYDDVDVHDHFNFVEDLV